MNIGYSEPLSPRLDDVPHRQLAARAIELLLSLRAKPTLYEFEPLLVALEAVRAIPKPEIYLLWSCPRCHADPWSLCVRPNGSELRRPLRRFRRGPECHAPRVDRGIAGLRDLSPEAWRVYLAESDYAKRNTQRVARDIKRGAIAKQLMRLHAQGNAAGRS